MVLNTILNHLGFDEIHVKITWQCVPVLLPFRYTYRAARLAAGTAAEMARQIVTGAVSNGMALVRPMGHNAGKTFTLKHALAHPLHAHTMGWHMYDLWGMMQVTKLP